jgi:hypothetical protein
MNLAAHDRPGPIGLAVNLCEALSARAFARTIDRQHHEAIKSLSAARTLAVDLGDGQTLHHKALSVEARSCTYDAVRRTFESASLDETALRLYVRWALEDPPLVRYRSAMIAERHRGAQLVEAASIGSDPGAPGFLELEVLGKYASGFEAIPHYSGVELATLARSVTPQQLLEVMDLYYREAEHWDDLTAGELRIRSDRISTELNSRSAFALCRPLLSALRPAFEYRGRVRTKRAVMMLTACVCDCRLTSGQWPKTLANIVPKGYPSEAIGPYVNARFGYQISDGLVKIYALDDDGVEPSGHLGSSGNPETDAVLLNAALPQPAESD